MQQSIGLPTGLSIDDEEPDLPSIAIIPARYASTRLPGKPLADIGGRPMVCHVCERAAASGVDRVIVAADDARIVEAVERFGGEAMLTRSDHRSGTDRIAEVVARLGLSGETLVVNVQGDEPLLPPESIDQVIAGLRQRPQASVATLSERIGSEAELRSPAVVKVVTDHEGYALYFSRALIPWPRDGLDSATLATAEPGWQRHIGLYAYRAEYLQRMVTVPAPTIEQLESLEQLRVLWAGGRIHVAQARVPSPAGVDTPHDLERVRALLAGRAG